MTDINDPDKTLLARFDLPRAKAAITEWTDIEGDWLLENLLAALAETIQEDPRIQELRDMCDAEDEGSWAMGYGRGGTPSTVDIRWILNGDRPDYLKPTQQ